MKLSEQVTTVETSRKLLAAGVDCHAAFCWSPAGSLLGTDKLSAMPPRAAGEHIPAFTAPELMDGTGINLRQYFDVVSGWTWCARVRTGGNRQRLKYDPNPADAVAALILAQFAVEAPDAT